MKTLFFKNVTYPRSLWNSKRNLWGGCRRRFATYEGRAIADEELTKESDDWVRLEEAFEKYVLYLLSLILYEHIVFFLGRRRN